MNLDYLLLVELQSNHQHQQTNTQLVTGQMRFLSSNQQCLSTEWLTLWHYIHYLLAINTIITHKIILLILLLVLPMLARQQTCERRSGVWFICVTLFSVSVNRFLSSDDLLYMISILGHHDRRRWHTTRQSTTNKLLNYCGPICILLFVCFLCLFAWGLTAFSV